MDVEQILGRILRLPHTCQHTQPALNMSYVLTSSNDFENTVQHIIKGLNSAGFSEKDYRLSEPAAPQPAPPIPVQMEIPDPPLEPADGMDGFSHLDGKSIGEEL